VVASVSGKYKHAPSGFSVDKLQLQKDGKVQAEVSLAGVAPGLNFTFKVRARAGRPLAPVFVFSVWSYAWLEEGT
jgi:hypothetical protein